MTTTAPAGPDADAAAAADTETDAPGLRLDTVGPVRVVTLDRPRARNAVDGPTARALARAFRAFDADPTVAVAVLTGAHGHFCAGADLKAVAADPLRANPLHADMEADGPMGPTRLTLAKPVIAAIEGAAVAGGLELAAWCALRVMAEDATLGVFCRRFGVPLIDGGTVRLPRLVGASRAADWILTGRPVGAAEALASGFANRLCPPGQALAVALALAREIAAFPQACLRADWASFQAQDGMAERDALAREFAGGLAVIAGGETRAGAERFRTGAGRHGAFGDGSDEPDAGAQRD